LGRRQRAAPKPIAVTTPSNVTKTASEAQSISEAENLSVYGRFWESLAGFHRVESSNGI
jgi:hypothetical protein